MNATHSYLCSNVFNVLEKVELLRSELGRDDDQWTYFETLK